MNPSPLVIFAIVGSAVVTAASLIWSHKATKKLIEQENRKDVMHYEKMLRIKKESLIRAIDKIQDEEDYRDAEFEVDNFIDEQHMFLDEVVCAQNILDLYGALGAKFQYKPKSK